MEKLVFSSKYFNPLDTLSCGQLFRYREYERGYLVFSLDKICYLYEDGESVVIESDDIKYFENYFDLTTDYQSVYNSAKAYGNETLTLSAELGKGVRILRQDALETLFSFIISQNNNIKRISQTIEKLAEKAGKKTLSKWGEYYAFPSVNELEKLSENDYKELGFGYRGRYFIELVKKLKSGYDFSRLKGLKNAELFSELTSITGVGAKVANCVMLFGFYRTESFPVDTWIDKIYRENFNGKLVNREKITNYFIGEFGINSGYYQQYLFYYKRSLESKNK